MSTPRESVRAAFVAILTAANLGVTIYDRLPFTGADPRSVVLTIVSGLTRSMGIGLRQSATTRGLEKQFRLQIDCYSDDTVAVGKLADAVELALMNAIYTLSATYDIHGLRKVADIDTPMAGSGPLTREARATMDFLFYTTRVLAT